MPSLRKRQTWPVAGAIAAALVAAAGTNPPPAAPATGPPRGVPAAPPETGSAAPSEPARVWISGTLTDVTDARIDVREPSGQDVTMQRLAAGTTSFYRVSNGGWAKLAPQAQVSAGQTACTEALLAGTNLLALRVFLGTGCGPA
jgi:hypothetical protein